MTSWRGRTRPWTYHDTARDHRRGLASRPVPPEVLEQVLIGGDLSGLTEAQRLAYYRAVCQSLGLNPLSKPFEYLWLNGKLRLYALRDCADQLRRLHGISITITSRERLGDLYLVTARARDQTGREDESLGAVTSTIPTWRQIRRVRSSASATIRPAN